MVENSRTPARPDQLRPLNEPRRVRVTVEGDRPVALVTRQGANVPIEQIQEHWCIDDEWWRDHIQRHYYRVLLQTGSIRTIYHDLNANAWFEQSY